jgi:surfeit locus 1 family protein
MRRAVPWLMFIIMELTLVSLGLWQLQRMVWKEDLIARAQANASAAPVPLTANLPEFRAVRFGCVFAAGVEFAPGGSAQGRAGQRAWAACTTPEGQRLVVDRGFVPIDRRVAEIPPQPPAEVTGQLRAWPIASTAERIAGARTLSPADFGLPPATLLVQATAIAPLPAGAAAPIPTPLDVAAIPNNHQSYAIQWFSFAAILGVIFGLFLRRSNAVER